MINNNFEDVVMNRKSVKVFDETVKIPQAELPLLLKYHFVSY